MVKVDNISNIYAELGKLGHSLFTVSGSKLAPLS
jgi:hypothetical protein